MQTLPTFPAYPTKDTTGLNIRQLFAVEAMKGILSAGNECHEHPEKVANASVLQADALIKALGND